MCHFASMRMNASDDTNTRGFYFDVGGVLVPDRFGTNARGAFEYLAERHPMLRADQAYRAYVAAQPGLDLGNVGLESLCEAIGLERSTFEEEWLAMHPVDQRVSRIITQLLSQGHRVGLATNICRRFLNLLLERTRLSPRLVICCSADIGIAKPDREFFAHANGIIDANQVVFVDDRSINVSAAQAFGWIGIHANKGWLKRFERTYLTV